MTSTDRLARLDTQDIRGALVPGFALGDTSWFRVGGAAELYYQPADADDLALFLKRLPEEVPVTIVGLGSNLLVRDGGIAGFVVRLSAKGFGVDALIEKAVQHTPAVVQQVRAQLPQGFPMEVAEPIFEGLLNAAERLGRAFDG